MVSLPEDSAAASVARERRLKVRKNLRFGGLWVIVLAAAIVLWELIVRVFEFEPIVFPGPRAVLDASQQHLPSLLQNAGTTFGGTLTAFAISAVVGIVLAILMVQFEFLRRVFFPMIVALQAAPKIALAPLLIIYVGFGLKTAILIAVLIAVFPVIVNTAVGLETVEPELMQLARTMHAGSFTLFWRIRLPFALPHIVSGLKNALVLAVVGIVVGEFTASNGGLGFLMLTASANFNTPLVYACLIFLTSGSLLLFYALQTLEHSVAWYRRDLQGTEKIGWGG